MDPKIDPIVLVYECRCELMCIIVLGVAQR